MTFRQLCTELNLPIGLVKSHKAFEEVGLFDVLTDEQIEEIKIIDNARPKRLPVKGSKNRVARKKRSTKITPNPLNPNSYDYKWVRIIKTSVGSKR